MFDGLKLNAPSMFGLTEQASKKSRSIMTKQINHLRLLIFNHVDIQQSQNKNRSSFDIKYSVESNSFVNFLC